MKTIIFSLVTFLFAGTLLFPISVWADSPAEKRVKIDKMADETLKRLWKEHSSAKNLFNKAHGYAIFDQSQAALMLSTGMGKGVAINRKSGSRIYMKAAKIGIGIGIGFQFLYTVFLFQNQKAFKAFLEEGWDADTTASAAGGTKGIAGASTFVNGVAMYQMTDKGLIAQASLKGAKYWKDDDLNKK